MINVAREHHAYVKDGVIMGVGSYIVGSSNVADAVAKELYGETAFALEVSQYPVQKDDTYEGGKFYRMVEGVKTEIAYVRTETEQLDDLNTAVDDLIIAVLER